MHRKRTTGPDGIPRPAVRRSSTVEFGGIVFDRRTRPTALARTLVVLARSGRRLRHLPSVGQLRTMVRMDGRQPCTYRLDRASNWLPESLPVDFPYGANGLCVVQRGHELVLLPCGAGFALN